MQASRLVYCIRHTPFLIVTVTKKAASGVNHTDSRGKDYHAYVWFEYIRTGEGS
jgi:hypothetical protein